MNQSAYSAMQRNLILSSNGSDCGSRKCKRGYNVTCGGVCQSLRLTGVWSQAVGFVLVRLTRMWPQLPWRCSHISFSLQINVSSVLSVRFANNAISFVRFQVLTAASMMFRVVFWNILPCKIIVDRRYRGAYWLIPDDGGSTYLWNVGRQ
jgi:hypothetical protein